MGTKVELSPWREIVGQKWQISQTQTRGMSYRVRILRPSPLLEVAYLIQKGLCNEGAGDHCSSSGSPYGASRF